VPAEGRTRLTESDVKLLADLRKAETLRWLAYQKRDELIVEAHKRGIKCSIIAAAAGFCPTGGGRNQIYKVVKRPFKVGMAKPGRQRKSKDGSQPS
jgi:hypothetical protein